MDAGCPEETDDQSVLLKYGCFAELTFQQHGMSCQGVGVAEEVIDNDRGQFTYTRLEACNILYVFQKVFVKSKKKKKLLEVLSHVH